MKRHHSLTAGLSWLLLAGVALPPLTVPLMSAPAIAQTRNVPFQLQQAYTLLSQGLVNQAIAQFERYLRSNPRSLEGQLGVAIAYRRAGRNADAFRAYGRVLEIDPNNRLALDSLGLLGEFRPEWQARGIEALTTLITLEPGNTSARAQRGKLYFFEGRFNESIADFQVALQGNPSPDVLSNAGQVFTYSGDFRQGLELFNRYRATGRPFSPNAAIAYALALRETGNLPQAIQVLEGQLRSIGRVNAASIQVRAALATAYAEAGRMDQAKATLAPLRGRQDSRLALARALSVLGRTDAASAQESANLYRQVITTINRPSVALIREAADVLSGMPQMRAIALQLYDQLIQQLPNDKGLLAQRLVVATEAGTLSRSELEQQLRAAFPALPADPVQLRGITQALIRLDPPSPNLLPLYRALAGSGVTQPFLNFRIAQALIQQGDLPGARAALSTFSSTATGTRDQGAILLLLAEIDQREGNLNAAAQRYQSILASGTTDQGVTSGAVQGLASVYQRLGRTNEAIALYDQLIARNPQDLSKQLGRASLAYQAGLISEASAAAVLNQWLQTRALSETPIELFSLAGALPPAPEREQLYTALLEVDPGSIPVQLRLLQVVAARNPAQADALVARLIARDPNNLSAYFVQGQLSQATGNLGQAARAYEAILKQQPSNASALSALGGVRFRQGQYSDAARLYNQVLTLNPQDQTAQTALISLNAAQGNRMQALQQLEQIALQQMANGGAPNPAVMEQRQRIQEGFLQQRGFQPPWERY